MALKGTLKDFGIAEILQLIGQQAKSGVLHLASKDDEIHLLMASGNVVSAEYAGRKAREKLGNLLVRAGLVTDKQLAEALDEQKRTLRRLGDILVDLEMVSRDDLKEMTALQTTETVYRLFAWKSGTYEFVPGEVEWDASTVTPLRAESVLMEGFRQIDEWPAIKKRITSQAMTFERVRELADAPARPREEPGPPKDDVDAAFDAFAEEKPEERKGEFASLGANERRVHGLATPGQPVSRIVDLSRLGEFETCRALLNLVNLGVLRPVAPPKRSAAAGVGAYARDWHGRIRRGAASVVATLAIAATLAGLAYYVNERGSALADAGGGRSFRDTSGQRFLSRFQVARLAAALEVYRLERGAYPDALRELVQAGLLDRRDLRYPWREDYYYRRRAEGGFVLLPPVQ